MEVAKKRCLAWLEKLNASDENALYFEVDSSRPNSLSFVLGEGSLGVRMTSEGVYLLEALDGDELVISVADNVNEQLKSVYCPSSIEDLLEFIYNAAINVAKKCDEAMDDGGYEEEDSAAEVKPDAEWLKYNLLTHRLDVKEKEIRQLKAQKEMKDSQNEKIFSAAGSSICLRNELIALMKDAESLGFEVEAIDDNIFQWRVKMLSFDSESDLNMDMTLVYDRYKYSYVEFQLTFAMDLFPFYPPMVTVIRPRFVGFMPGKLANLTELHPQNWDVVNGIRVVLARIRAEFEAGRVDLDAQGNDPSSDKIAYFPIENLLLKLGLATETSSRSAFAGFSTSADAQSTVRNSGDTLDLKRLKSTSASNGGASESAPIVAAKAAGAKTYWAKGTGYGRGEVARSKWTPEQYQAIKVEKTKNEVDLTGQIADLLVENLRINTDFHLLGETRVIMSCSCLVPLLCQYLKTSSLLEMDQCKQLYFNYFKILHAIASSPYYRSLLLQHSSFLDELSLEQLSADLFRRISKFATSKSSLAVVLKKATLSDVLLLADRAPWNGKDLDDYVTLVLICVREACAVERMNASAGHASSSSPVRVESKAVDAGEESSYMAAMKDLQFDEMERLSGYHYASEIRGVPSTAGPRAKRLMKELSGMCDALPLSLSSSMWVRTMEGRIDAMQAMISGPEGTPYMNGLFLFDLYFPPNYPAESPKVNLQTTGRGAVRFNPNLYACGKVCLSLLGTWRGDAGENWSELTSTVLQVLVSIQSLILVPDPYFNEPGYESTLGTPEGTRHSKNYNNVIQEVLLVETGVYIDC